MIGDNEGGRNALESDGDAGAGSGVEHGFRAPARRRKPIYMAAATVFVVMAVLVYLMANPRPERMAESFVDAALASLPDGALAAEDLRTAVANLNSALDMVARHRGALETMQALQGRVERQLTDDILGGELADAEALLGAANAAWPGAPQFGPVGPLRQQLVRALEARALRDEVRNLLAEVKRRVEDDADESLKALQAALAQLRTALDAAQRDEVDATVRADVRRSVVDASRDALASNGPERAQRLLDTLEGSWGEDEEVDRLREEVRERFAELSRSRHLEELLDKGDASLVDNRLTTPRDDNAVAYFRQALVLDPASDRAVRGLAAVAERYAVLIGDAIDRGSLTSARRFLASLSQVSPAHPRIDEFATRIDAAVAEAEAREARNAVADEAARPDAAVPPKAPPAEPVPDDPEGRLWYTVRGDCDQKELRRYLDTYPEGRYIDQAWQRISDCLAATGGGP